MNLRSLVIVILGISIISSCGKEPPSSSPPDASGSPSEIASPSEAEDTLPERLVQSDPREQIVQLLSSYYEDLEAEQLDEARYFAPTVHKFYSQTDQPREKVGEIIRQGFEQIEARKIDLDLSSLTLREEKGQYIVEFSGHSSLRRGPEGKVEEEDFRNRLVFNQDFLITAYGPASAETTAAAQRVMGPAAQARSTIESLTAALASYNLNQANQFIHPDIGLYYLTRPGALDAVYAVENFEEIVAYSPWMEKSFKNFSCDLKLEPIPEFDCEDFSKNGCFLDEIKGYDRLGVLLEALIENELNLFDADQIKAAKSAEKLVSLQLTQTGLPIALFFGQIEGTWYLLVVDSAIYDCSA